MILNNRYEFNPKTDQLGKGAFGKVYLATDRQNNAKVALKVIDKEKFVESYNHKVEINRAKYFNHPNVVKYKDGFEHVSTDSIGDTKSSYVMVMEYINGGNLKDLMKQNLSQKQKHNIILKTFAGIKYIHSQRILHLDLKPDNILIQKEADGTFTPKISDFGISKQMKDDYEYVYAIQGTTEYMSPEQLNLVANGKVSRRSDIWSMGIIMYELFLNETPFVNKNNSSSHKSQVINALLKKAKPPRLNDIPTPFRDAIQNSLIHEPGKRTGNADEVIRAIPLPVEKTNPTPRYSMSSSSAGSADNNIFKISTAVLAVLTLLFFFLFINKKNANKRFNQKERSELNALRDSLKALGNELITVSAYKTQVLYIGVDNPISVTANGVSSKDIEIGVTGAGGTVKSASQGNFVITVSKPGECEVNVRAGDLTSSKTFRVKRIPDPVARLSKSSGGTMGSGEFKAQGGVGAFLDNFDFDAICIIQGYNLVHVPKRQDAVESINAGARYNAGSKRLVQQAKPGDIYYFDNVKARCPGDAAGRVINSMVFKIK